MTRLGAAGAENVPRRAHAGIRLAPRRRHPLDRLGVRPEEVPAEWSGEVLVASRGRVRLRILADEWAARPHVARSTTRGVGVGQHVVRTRRARPAAGGVTLARGSDLRGDVADNTDVPVRLRRVRSADRAFDAVEGDDRVGLMVVAE